MKYIRALLFFTLFFLFCMTGVSFGQKKSLDHSVYDGWQDIGRLDISSNGAYVYYEVKVQKGDGSLFVQAAKGDTVLKVPRGQEGYFSKDNHYFVCKIAAPYIPASQEGTAIAQKKNKDKDATGMLKMSRDSLLVFDLTGRRGVKYQGLDKFKIAGRQHEFVIWLSQVRDTASLSEKKPGHKDAGDKKRCFELNVLRFGEPDVRTFGHVNLFEADTNANYLAFTRLVGANQDSMSLNYLNMETGRSSQIFEQAKEIKAIALSGSAELPVVAFVASGVKMTDTLGKQNDIYRWQLNEGAGKLIDYKDQSFPENWEISPYTKLSFSHSGKRLFFNTAPGKAEKDSKNETVDLDIWNTESDVLFTEHKINADRLSKRGYLAAYFLDRGKVLQIEDSVFSDVIKTGEGDGDYFYLSTDSSRRIDKQWLGYTLKDYYIVNMRTDARSEVISNINGRIYPSFKGRRALLYDREKRQYSLFNAASHQIRPITGITFPVYDEDYDRVEAPPNYGVLGWDTITNNVYVYDRYDMWRIEPQNLKAFMVNRSGRAHKVQTRLYLKIKSRQPYYFNGSEKLNFNCYYEETKNNNYIRFALNKPKEVQELSRRSDHKTTSLSVTADNIVNCAYTLENYQQSPQVYVTKGQKIQRLSDINQQQNHYFWGTANLFKWKAPTGKQTQGIVYLPENLDTSKKYPMITYFYERRSETLNSYIPPKPTGSALNISFFVSRGYVVFVPDIWYTMGHPGQSAYDYVFSGIKSLEHAYPFIDSSKLGVQGQSWGGYQVAYLITQTNLFKAAWAGAPVVDMFSAYGGIRWKTGSSRAMQYEKGQSRIGVSPWENKGLYIENSPLFFVPRVQTPLVIMSNDGDGAVPWYQGIEFFMALRRFGKQAWLLNYRGEEHNLVKRENKEDIQKKEAEYFDWQLKDAPRPSWTY